MGITSLHAFYIFFPDIIFNHMLAEVVNCDTSQENMTGLPYVHDLIPNSNPWQKITTQDILVVYIPPFKSDLHGDIFSNYLVMQIHCRYSENEVIY